MHFAGHLVGSPSTLETCIPQFWKFFLHYVFDNFIPIFSLSELYHVDVRPTRLMLKFYYLFSTIFISLPIGLVFFKLFLEQFIGSQQK